MGCDIHSVAQIYNKQLERWVTIAIDIGGDPRNYELFGYLAGVRSSIIEPFIEQRGLPENFKIDSSKTCIHKAGHFIEHGSSYTLEAGNYDGTVWMGDHSHTWYTLAELERCVQHHHKRWWELGLLQIVAELERLRRIHNTESKHIRYVIGFDS